jgi:hypothetical protein
MSWTAGVYTRTNGVFSGPHVWQSDFNALVKIVFSRHDVHDEDLAQGINACLNKNGQNSPTDDIDWGGFKITNLGTGSSASDAARFGQTITAAAVDATSKILTLTRPDGDVQVDLTPITVAGDTSDFARKTLSNNFTGVNTFDAEVSAKGGVSVGSGASAWTITGDSDGTFRFNSFNAIVSAISIVPVSNGIAEIWPDGTRCWTGRTLDPTVFLRANVIATVTAAWSFSQSLQVGGLVIAGNGYSWSATTPGPNTLQFAGTGGNFLKLSSDPTYGSKLESVDSLGGGLTYWNNANLVVSPTLPVTGSDFQVALVSSGADKGVWVYVSPTGWTKIAS